jgi:Ca-activated chloride channel family protein
MNRARRVALALAMGVLLVAGCGRPVNYDLSEPSQGGVPQAAPSVPTVLILDASGSMAESDAPGPRIDAAKAAATSLADALPDGATVGLTTYGTGTGNSEAERSAGCQDVTTALALGPLDRDQMRKHIDGLHPSGWTPMSLALNVAVAQLPADGTPQAIVLVSDGEDTCGAPPCDTATTAKTSHPSLTISTVGFKTEGPANEQLNCIANVTGGLFVEAQNASQLAARLLATQNVGQARTSLSSTGLGDIGLEMTVAAIRAAHPDFPDASTSGSVTVVYRDCDFGFRDGVLTSIGPHGGGRTIDGVEPGTPLSRATELYGKPVSTATNPDGTHAVVYAADPNTNAGYYMLVDEFADRGDEVSGVVRAIVLCRCAPKGGSSPPSAAGPEIVVLKPVDANGNTQAGWTKDSSDRDSLIDCSFGGASPFDMTEGVRFCGGTADSGDACWPTANNAYVLCLWDPFDTVLHLRSAAGLSTPRSPQIHEPWPIGLLLDDGTQCRARNGGAWSYPEEQPDWVGFFSCGGARYNAIWAPSDGDGIDRGPDGWTVTVGPSDGHLTTRRVTRALFVGVA